jgi:hypothetical protein
MDTETIDRLFLELSQFTTATTRREIELRELNAELLQDLIEVLPYAKSWAGLDDTVVRNAEKTIAKAKQLNEHTT